MTIELPDNHYAEITFDNFEMMKTTNCMGDYLEILEYRGYKDSGASMAYGEDDSYFGRLTNSKAHSNVLRRKRQSKNHLAVGGDDTGAMSHNGDELSNLELSGVSKINKSSKSNEKTNPRIVNLNSRINKRRPNFKWHSLGHFCGKFDSGYTFRATSNIINFKFRPLASNHQFMSTFQHRANFRFKIYFQGMMT
jgi:hypothetical protein